MSFWLNQPDILFKYPNIKQVIPSDNLSVSENLNALSRVTILLSLVGYAFIKRKVVLYLGLIILGVIVLYYKMNKEGFSEFHTGPIHINNNNPLGNSLVNEIPKPIYNKNVITAEPGRPETNHIDYLGSEKNIHDTTKKAILEINSSNNDIGKIFDGLSGELNFENNMRSFYTIVDNDQSKFLDYCFKDLPSDKAIVSY
jgi:hypothetical protein